MFEYDDWEYGTPSCSFQDEARFPYADGVAGPPESHTFQKPFSSTFHASTVFAQDSLGRHVVLKIVEGNSEEYKILNFLLTQVDWSDVDNFPCVIPVLRLLPYEENWLAVMPRWGSNPSAPWFATCSEVLDAIHGYLQGLAFLHEHRIFHRDLDFPNLFVNHFCCPECSHDNTFRHALRKQGRAKYAIADFNLSMMLEPGTSLRDYRLPVSDAYGVHEKPHEVHYAQPDFNPFAYDVGALGIQFRYEYGHLSSEIPILAPLLGGMTTYDIEKRFTAAAALAFLDDNRKHLSEEQLSAVPSQDTDHDIATLPWDLRDMWSGLSAEHLARWGLYRETRPNIFERAVLGWLCRREWGWTLVFHVRLFCRHLLSFASASFSLSSSLRIWFNQQKLFHYDGKCR
ncbi:unnamed protein product [Cyclocybe aegerita]|uniref:Protein kinase domain-containing protein n=1 Tax=Cyclocybe aegerita TaxID=1973307 RepID=A0A8S0W015_CYCAE|nr:unnamed protein product [Cyclocybe aegerita]